MLDKILFVFYCLSAPISLYLVMVMVLSVNLFNDKRIEKHTFYIIMIFLLLLGILVICANIKYPMFDSEGKIFLPF